jgi:phosphoenolpyruvate carboxykinase (ATP)
VLDPRSTWTDATQYDTQARSLARMFVENFKTFEADVVDAVRKAGPTV